MFVCPAAGPPGYVDDDRIDGRGLTCSAVMCDQGQRWDGMLMCYDQCRDGWTHDGMASCYQK